MSAVSRDRRLLPANGRVAADWLRGEVAADAYLAGTGHSVAVPVTDLRRGPDGARDRQLLLGAAVTRFEERDGWSFVQSAADGYVGYVRSADLGAPQETTHHVATPATHLYAEPDIKSPDLAHLPFGARLKVVAEHRRFWETDRGYVPKPHLWPVAKCFTDPATVAALHFGVPYLWGGNSVLGIDCSGLVQAALLACGLDCPGDSDLQCAALGQEIGATEALRRGDLVFWRGHVGMMVDEATLIHANAHHMAVAYEPLDKAMLRISAQEGGEVIARKRL